MSHSTPPRIVLALVTLATFSASCGYGTIALPQSTDTVVKPTAKGVGTFSQMGIVGTADTAAVPQCEVDLTLSSFDGVITSKPICIKSAGHGVAIPQQILLYTPTTTTTVKLENYCTSVNDETVGCVWNRKFLNTYPMGFTLSSHTAGHPLGEYVALVRVLRNGRIVFSWSRKEAPAAPLVNVPITAVTEQEFFRDPVDLGLYVLDSGADEAKAATASQYDIARSKWSQTLSNAISGALLSQAPPELAEAYDCFKYRLQYLRAVSQNNSKDVATAEKAINDLETKQQDIAKAFTAVTASGAQDRIRVATDQSVDTKTGTSADGTKLVDGDIVLVLPQNTNSVTLYKAHLGASWEPIKPDAIGAAQVGTATRWLARIKDGTRRGAVFSLQVDAGHLSATRESQPVLCASPDKALANMTATVSDKIQAVAQKTSSGAAIVTALSTQKSDVDNFITSAKADLEKGMADLPSSTQADIKKGVFWVQAVDQTTAAALASTTELEALAPTLTATIESAVKDPESRVTAYATFASSLPTDGTLWSKPIPNPAPGPGEANFPMTFITPHQSYWFLAWNAVLIPVLKSSGVQTGLTVDNLIPLIDIYGMHFQMESVKVPSWGFGLGFVGTRETITPSNGMTYTSNFALGAQLNISVSAFRLGGGYMFRHADDCTSNCYWDAKNLRIIVGADLLRLFTGKDAALATSAAVGTGSNTSAN